MQVTGFTKETMEESISNETMGKKCCIAVNSAIHLIFAGIVGIILCAWWGNQKSIAGVYDGSGNFYDQLPNYYY